MTLLELRDALKAAKYPTAALNVAIECALFGAREIGEEYAPHTRDTYRVTKDGILYNPPSFTGSLDAGMTLVPEGIGFTVGSEPDGTPFARIWGCELEWAATPALALCLACVEHEISMKSKMGAQASYAEAGLTPPPSPVADEGRMDNRISEEEIQELERKLIALGGQPPYRRIWDGNKLYLVQECDLPEYTDSLLPLRR